MANPIIWLSGPINAKTHISMHIYRVGSEEVPNIELEIVDTCRILENIYLANESILGLIYWKCHYLQI